MFSDTSSPAAHHSRARLTRETTRVARIANDQLNCRLLQTEDHSTNERGDCDD